MKKVISIARVELASMFYSPIAWVVLMLFIIQVGIDFADILTPLEAEQFIGRSQSLLTFRVFSDPEGAKGLLRFIQERMFLFIPLLTMGIISREIHSGSIKLSLSSPISISGIILGKFLAMMVIGLLFVIVLILYMFAGMASIEHMDWTSVMAAVLGVYLLICTYSAIGIFISSLTRYQIMAAISTFILLGLLNYMGEVWQDNDFFRDITHNMCIAGRLDTFIDGLVITREVFYFLNITIFFLALTTLRLWYDRKSASVSMRLAGYSILSVALIAVGFITSYPPLVGYWDLTATQRNTMSAEGQKMLKRFKGPLELTTYANMFQYDIDRVKPASRYRDLKHLEYYQRFRPDMKINYVYYYDTIQGDMSIYYDTTRMDQRAILEAEFRGVKSYITPEQFYQRLNFRNREGIVLRELKIGDKKEYLGAFYADFYNPYASEREYMAALKRLLDKPADLRFVVGHNEKEIFTDGGREFQTVFNHPIVRPSLRNQGVHSDTLSLMRDSIPNNLTALVIADPKMDYLPEEIEKLKRYIDHGGNLMIFAEPRKREIINPLLESLGLRMMKGMVLMRNGKIRVDMVKVPYKQPLTKDDQSGIFLAKGPGGLEVINSKLGFDIEYTAVSETDSSWYRPVLADFRDSIQVTFSESLGDRKEEIPVLLKLTRNRNNKQQKVLVASDADAFTKDLCSDFNGMEQATSMLNWFTDGAYPVKTSYTFGNDNLITVNKNELFYLKWLFIGGLPGFLFIGCTVVLVRRKRK